MSVKLTPALTSPFAAEKEVSWAASRLSVCWGKSAPAWLTPSFSELALALLPSCTPIFSSVTPTGNL